MKLLLSLTLIFMMNLILLSNCQNTNQSDNLLLQTVVSSSQENKENLDDIIKEEQKLQDEELVLQELKKELNMELKQLELENDDKFDILAEKFNKINDVKTPSMIVVSPIRRLGSTHAEINLEPCGGIIKDKADTLTNVGSKINAIWEVRQPIGGGNCTVSISSGLDINFTSLRPSDGIVFDSNYSFPCGRKSGFEYKQFDLPENYACDQCTLQIIWNNPAGRFYQCSDLMILGNKGMLTLFIYTNYPSILYYAL